MEAHRGCQHRRSMRGDPDVVILEAFGEYGVQPASAAVDKADRPNTFPESCVYQTIQTGPQSVAD